MSLDTFFMFGFLITLLAAVYFFFEHKNTKEKLQKEQRDHEKKLFELNLLSEVSDKIGYSLSSRDIAHTISMTAGKLFHVTAVTYGIVEQDHIEIISITHEKVGPNYIAGVKDVILQGIYAIDADLKNKPVIQKVQNAVSSEPSSSPQDILDVTDDKPKSYFNIPLVLNNRFTGIINITSKEVSAYQEEDMSMLYKIVNRAQLAVGRLENVIETEKSKVESLVKSLSSGAMFFTLEDHRLKLFTINSAARRFLNLDDENLDPTKVLSVFKVKPNIITEIKDIIMQKKSTIYRDVTVNELKFTIYLTPVFSLDTDSIIGVALTMQDVTREHETQRIREVFTNMMIHELRAPLTAIKGAADLLLNPETVEEDRVKMRLIIKNASGRLLQDIDDMLDSAKIDAGKLSIEKTRSNINETVRKTVEELTYAAKSRAILIENHLDENIPVFEFDAPRIGQVIVNLLSNSIKYSESHTLIEVFTRLKTDFVEIEVKDHGSGISKEKIDTLFKPFAQAHQIKKIHGTGLGLYISKAIVTGHGGEIRIESDPGQGTSIFVTLPLKTESYEHLLTPKLTN